MPTLSQADLGTSRPRSELHNVGGFVQGRLLTATRRLNILILLCVSAWLCCRNCQDTPVNSASRFVLPQGWGSCRHTREKRRSARVLAAMPSESSAGSSDAVAGVHLPAMASDEPEWLSFVIARYLDEEWIEQEVHQEIGDAVAESYRKARDSGEDELVAVLAKISFDLKEIWSQGGFREAFEGPADVANRAVEFLMLRQGRQVWSYGGSNSDVQQKLLQRLSDYDDARRKMLEAADASPKHAS
eukprot:TRINITY_DN79050_c0_g1_i1.p1 TRINITY_DN79050_c0_g1~~TRINITY_DN79050_c0_g1_i1.p1  ORF type:complete len:244 (-),score=44.83 TRINITY_DN79050_c0_g1_i1:220-951(-)